MSNDHNDPGAPRATPASSGARLADELTAMLKGRLPGLLGMRIVEASDRLVIGQLPIREELLAPNGYLHAATVVGLADTTCGIGTRLSLPSGASGFTTVELKTNYLGTARSGTITATARPVHAGRQTQVWDAEIHAGDDRRIALFRCTQLLSYR